MFLKSALEVIIIITIEIKSQNFMKYIASYRLKEF